MTTILSQRLRTAIEILIAISKHDDTTTGDIAGETGFSFSCVEGVVAKLARAGFVNTRRGQKGGVSLAKGTRTILIIDVARAFVDDVSPIDRAVITSNVTLWHVTTHNH